MYHRSRFTSFVILYTNIKCVGNAVKSYNIWLRNLGNIGKFLRFLPRVGWNRRTNTSELNLCLCCNSTTAQGTSEKGQFRRRFKKGVNISINVNVNINISTIMARLLLWVLTLRQMRCPDNWRFIFLTALHQLFCNKIRSNKLRKLHNYFASVIIYLYSVWWEHWDNVSQENTVVNGALIWMSGGRLLKRITFRILEGAVRRGWDGKRWRWTDCLQNNVSVSGIARVWKAMVLKADAELKTATGGWRRFRAAWRK